jgi:hypothetical protein
LARNGAETTARSGTKRRVEIAIAEVTATSRASVTSKRRGANHSAPAAAATWATKKYPKIAGLKSSSTKKATGIHSVKS